MRTRPGPFVATLALSSSCGPEAAIEPRTGVYDFTVETVVNDCDPRFENFTRQDLMSAVRLVDDRLTVGYTDFLGFRAQDCPECAPLGGWAYPSMSRDAETGGFTWDREDMWNEWEGCRRWGNHVDAEVLDANTVRALTTQQWADGGGCWWLAERPEGCSLVFKYTYTLRETCDGCTLDELRDRIVAIYEAEHPLPK